MACIVELIDGAIVLDDLGDCALGVTDAGLMAYDFEEMVSHFVDGGMTREDAVEWIDFNVMGLQCNGEGFVMVYV